MTDYHLAAQLIAHFEGFEPVAKWDVNHYRVGYGSDTEGPQQRNVVRGMLTTRDRALVNLAMRIPAFEKTIVEQVGSHAWSLVSDEEKAALLSVCYNYGHLPSPIDSTILSGESASMIAHAIEAREGDNRGINSHRRLEEAEIVEKVGYIYSLLKIDPPKDQGDRAKAPTPTASITAFNLPLALSMNDAKGLQAGLNTHLKLDPPLEINGAIDAPTAEAVRTFQKQTGVEPTGNPLISDVIALYEAIKVKL